MNIPSPNLKCRIFVGCFSHTKLLKIYYSTKLKPLCTFLHLYVFYSMCVQLFTVFEVAVLRLYVYIGECPKIQDGHHFHGKEPRNFFCLSVAAT